MTTTGTPPPEGLSKEQLQAELDGLYVEFERTDLERTYGDLHTLSSRIIGIEAVLFPTCDICGDELRTGRTHEEAGTCPTCDPTCWSCVEHPCICPPEPDGEPTYTEDGHPY